MKRSGNTSRSVVRRALVLSCAVVLVAMLAASGATLPFTLNWYDVQDLGEAVRHAPTRYPVVPFDSFDPTGLVSVLAPAARYVHTASSWAGHDDLGRSMVFRLLPGFLISLAIGLASATIAVVLGTLWGATAALVGGNTDRIMMRIVDVLFGLPYILMVILFRIALTQPLSALLGGQTAAANLLVLLVAIGAVSWLTMARVVRGQVLSLRSQPFVEAARAAGAGRIRILRRHLLPNLVGPVVVYATLVIPQAIMQESFLSFLGIGVMQPTPSLGRLAADGVEAVNTFVGYWWLIVYPCGVLVVTLVAMNVLGDALRDRLDPRSQLTTLV